MNENLDISSFLVSELEVCKFASFSVACDARIHNRKYLNEVQFSIVILSLNQDHDHKKKECSITVKNGRPH